MDMNDEFSPDKVVAFVQNAAVFFFRDNEISLPSGDEVRQLQEKGIKWRRVIAAYLPVGNGETLCLFATNNDITPPEDWQGKAYQGLVVNLANLFMKRVIEKQKAVKEAADTVEKEPEIVVP